jgi:hypothetical protein
MSMNASAMKSAIISKMNKEAESASAAEKKFGDAVLEYLVANMDVTFGWYAQNTSSGAVDPATSFKAVLSGSGTLGVPSSFSDMLAKLAALIKASITISPAAGFSVTGLAFNSNGVLTATMNEENNQDAAMQKFCEQVIDSLISSFPNTTNFSGSHAAFSGATTGMVIA